MLWPVNCSTRIRRNSLFFILTCCLNSIFSGTLKNLNTFDIKQLGLEYELQTNIDIGSKHISTEHVVVRKLFCV